MLLIENATVAMRWSAPELLNTTAGSDECEGARYSTKTDVWAFACTMLEVFDLTIPYAEYTNIWKVHQALTQDFQSPKVNESWDPEVQDIVKRCWEIDPEMRISADELYNRLTNLIKSDDAMGLEVKPRENFTSVKDCIGEYTTERNFTARSVTWNSEGGKSPPSDHPVSAGNEYDMPIAVQNQHQERNFTARSASWLSEGIKSPPNNPVSAGDEYGDLAAEHRELLNVTEGSVSWNSEDGKTPANDHLPASNEYGDITVAVQKQHQETVGESMNLAEINGEYGEHMGDSHMQSSRVSLIGGFGTGEYGDLNSLEKQNHPMDPNDVATSMEPFDCISNGEYGDLGIVKQSEEHKRRIENGVSGMNLILAEDDDFGEYGDLYSKKAEGSH